MHFFSLLLLSVISLHAVAFDRVNPDIHPGFTPSTTGAEGGIWMVMDNVEDKLKSSSLRILEGPLEAYLQQIVCRLATDYCEDIRVYVIRAPYFNATMAPNGMMQVWTGLLLRTQNESQIATVLGHEIGHYLKKHSLAQFESIKKKSAWASVMSIGLGAGVAAGGVSANVGNWSSSIGQLAMIASIYSYSRGAESEADKYGIQLLADAGYAAFDAAKIWDKVLAEEDSADNPRDAQFYFFRSHPSPEKRSETLSAYAQALQSENSVYGVTVSDDFTKIVDPYLDILIEDQINLGDFGRSEYVLNALRASGRERQLVSYYLGELYRKRNQDGDINRAMAYYEESASGAKPHAEALRALGMIHLKSKEKDAARSYFDRYLTSLPDASDRKMIEYYIRTIQ